MMARSDDDESGRFLTEERPLEKEWLRERKCVSIHLLIHPL